MNARVSEWPRVARSREEVEGSAVVEDHAPIPVSLPFSNGSHQSNGFKSKDSVAKENGVVGNPGPRHRFARHEAVRVGVVLQLRGRNRGNVSTHQ